eukprot:scaffold140884_cov29-Tisochrysis_lutea.AAC.2
MPKRGVSPPRGRAARQSRGRHTPARRPSPPEACHTSCHAAGAATAALPFSVWSSTEAPACSSSDTQSSSLARTARWSALTPLGRAACASTSLASTPRLAARSRSR